MHIKDLKTNYAPAAMVNWQEAGRRWPQPHPHVARLLRGLLWDQQYRYSNPQCEGGMPGSFELREDMGEDRLRAVEEWLRAEGYEYRFRRKRWRTWTRPDRPGEGLRPDGIEEDEDPNAYPSGASINVSLWDVIEKNFPEPGSERRLQGSSSASPATEKRSAGDRKRDRRWREYQESLAAEAAQGAKGGTPAPSPQRANGGHHPGSTTLGDYIQVAKQTQAKPRPLLLRARQAPAGPSSDVEAAHRRDIAKWWLGRAEAAETSPSNRKVRMRVSLLPTGARSPPRPRRPGGATWARMTTWTSASRGSAHPRTHRGDPAETHRDPLAEDHQDPLEDAHRVDPLEADHRAGEDPLDRADPAEALLQDPLGTPTTHQGTATRIPPGGGLSTSAGGSFPSSAR